MLVASLGHSEPLYNLVGFTANWLWHYFLNWDKYCKKTKTKQIKKKENTKEKQKKKSKKDIVIQNKFENSRVSGI